MKRFLAIAALCLSATATLSASVWTYPQDGATVGNPTYFDCSAPSTATYMKLWVHGWSNSLWTVHNTKRMVFVYFLPPGTYENLDAESGATPRAYEWGLSQWYNGTNYRMVFQPNYADSVWKVYDEAQGQWNATNITLAQVPIPTTEFKRVFLVGHPYTDTGGHQRVMVDAVQVGECVTTPCTDQDSDPIHVQPITTVANEPDNSVGTIAGNCGGTPGLEGNSQSLQLDLDSTHTSGKIWTDRYNVHLLP